MVVIDSRKMVIEENCGYVMGPATQTAPKKVVSETKKTPEHSQEYYKAVAILEARAEEREYDKAGVPSVGDIAASLGISKEELQGSPGQSLHQIESDPFSESHLPTEEEMLATFLEKDPIVNKKPEPLKKAEQSKDYDENGLLTVEQMKKDFGIKI